MCPKSTVPCFVAGWCDGLAWAGPMLGRTMGPRPALRVTGPREPVRNRTKALDATNGILHVRAPVLSILSLSESVHAAWHPVDSDSRADVPSAYCDCPQTSPGSI